MRATASPDLPPEPVQADEALSAWSRRSILVASGLAMVFLLVSTAAIWREGDDISLVGGRPLWLPAFVVLGSCSYLLRFGRWHVLTRRVAPRLRLMPSLRIYVAGFALGVTPGRIGEFFKFVLLRQETGVRELRSAPIFPIERATEAASFTALAIAGAALGHLTLGRLGTGAIVGVVALPVFALGGAAIRGAARRKRSAPFAGDRWIGLSLAGIRELSGPRTLAQALLCAFAARCFDATLFWIAASFVGIPLPLAGAALAFGLAGLTGGLSLLPAGVGAVEGSLVATVVALGGDAPSALVAALIARTFTLWIWVPAGLWFATRGAVAPATTDATEMVRS